MTANPATTIRPPHQPWPVDAQQQQLTDSYLEPARQEIAAWLLSLRQAVDAALEPKLPSFKGKPYPLGRCREIRDAVAQNLNLQTPQALIEFQRQGGFIGKIWGDLRGEYFQNALQFGAWYVDAANDTVNPDKPKLEILPLADSRFIPISDFHHFCRVAAKYWRVTITANTVFPRLAPFFPLICTGQDGMSRLAPAFDEMIELTRASGFDLSADILQSLPTPDDSISAALTRYYDGIEHPLLARDGASIEYCRQYRDDAQHLDQAFRDTAVLVYLRQAPSEQP